MRLERQAQSREPRDTGKDASNNGDPWTTKERHHDAKEEPGDCRSQWVRDREYQHIRLDASAALKAATEEEHCENDQPRPAQRDRAEAQTAERATPPRWQGFTIWFTTHGVLSNA